MQKDSYREDCQRLAYGLFVGIAVFLWAFGLTIAFAWRITL